MSKIDDTALIEESGYKIIEKKSFLDYFSIALTTFGVGYIPLAPGTWGSAVGVLIFVLIQKLELGYFAVPLLSERESSWIQVLNLLLLFIFCLAGIWTSSRAAKLFQKKDPSEAVVDEVMGQLVTFLFVPLTISWKFMLAGFLLFRFFDIWKPYPVRQLEILPGGLGICADDILAGVYAGICLAIIYAVSLTV